LAAAKLKRLVKRGTVDKLTEFLNNLDDSGSVKFTYEVETEGQLPFLDLLLKRTNSEGLKLLVYRKPTHTDQYLNFMSHHPIDHKISVVRTLLEKSQNLVSEPEDKKRKISMFKMPFGRVATQRGHFRRSDAR